MQAAGSLLGALQNGDCACGWLRPALTAMVVFWLLCLPIGLIFFVSFRITNQIRKKKIHFQFEEGAGSLAFYIVKVIKAESQPSALPFAHPAVVHSFLKFIFAAGFGVCGMMALRASATAYIDHKTDDSMGIQVNHDPNYLNYYYSGATVSNARIFISCLQAGVLWGLTLLSFAMIILLGTGIGRWLVVYLTNVLSVPEGRWFTLQPSGDVEVQSVIPSFTFLRPMAKFGTFIKAKVDEAFAPANVDALLCRGEWIKKDALFVFYGTFAGGRGVVYSIFLLIKSLLIGVVLTNDNGVIVPSLTKVKINFSSIF